jgi:3-phenylpropionate/trans-cinnamate dioxygenase ferredoxin subunit
MKVTNPIVRRDDVAPGTTHRTTLDGVAILVCNVGGTFYAIEDVCTHDGAPLDQGELTDCRITCRRHGAAFDVRTGAVLALPAVTPLETFAVALVDDVVYIDLSENVLEA